MARFFITCLSYVLFLSQGLGSSPPHYGEGWQWHSSLKANIRGKIFNFEDIHKDMYKHADHVSQTVNDNRADIVFIRFSVIYEETSEIKSESFKLMFPGEKKEIAFLSGWDKQPADMRLKFESDNLKDIRFFETFQQSSLISCITCQRYCVDWSQEEQKFVRRFNQSDSILGLHDPGDYYKNESSNPTLFKKEDYKLEKLASHAHEMTSLINTLIKDVSEICNPLTLCSSGANVYEYKGGDILNQIISNSTQQKKEGVREKHQKIKEKKKYFHMCAETLALDQLSIVMENIDSLPKERISGHKVEIAKALKDMLLSYKEKKPSHLIVHVHSTMDPCHVCSPTLWAETKLEKGIFNHLALLLGSSTRPVTFVSSSNPYKNRLYRPVSLQYEEFLSSFSSPNVPIPSPIAHIEGTGLDHVVQCRFKLPRIVVLLEEQQNLSPCEKYAKEYIKKQRIFPVEKKMSDLQNLSLEQANDFSNNAKEWMLLIYQDIPTPNIQSLLLNVSAKKILITSKNAWKYPGEKVISFTQDKNQTGIEKELDDAFSEPIIDTNTLQEFISHRPANKS